MTIHLPKDVESSLQAAVERGQFASLDDAMSAAAALLLERLGQQQNGPAAPEANPIEARKPIWEVIEEENRALPAETWDALPTDLSDQHDHYIYGTPKRQRAS